MRGNNSKVIFWLLEFFEVRGFNPTVYSFLGNQYSNMAYNLYFLDNFEVKISGYYFSCNKDNKHKKYNP